MALTEHYNSFGNVQIGFFVLILSRFSEQQHNRGYGDNLDGMHNFPIFYSLDSIMDALNEESKVNPEMVRMIVDSYYNSCNMTENVTPPVERKKPFIVIEGAYRSNRESLSGHIARRLDGEMIMMPPNCMANLVMVLPRGTRIRTLFYALSVYVVSEQVKQLLASNRAVVMNGYWTDQTSFIIERRFMRTENLPPKGDPIYDFPSDLVAPDILFYVSYPFDRNNNPYTTIYPNYKTKKLTIYERFRYPKMIEVSAENGFHHCVNRIYDNIFNLLGRKYDLAVTPQ